MSSLLPFFWIGMAIYMNFLNEFVVLILILESTESCTSEYTNLLLLFFQLLRMMPMLCSPVCGDARNNVGWPFTLLINTRNRCRLVLTNYELRIWYLWTNQSWQTKQKKALAPLIFCLVPFSSHYLYQRYHFKLRML